MQLVGDIRRKSEESRGKKVRCLRKLRPEVVVLSRRFVEELEVCDLSLFSFSSFEERIREAQGLPLTPKPLDCRAARREDSQV